MICDLLSAVSFVKEPDFYGPKHKRSRLDLGGPNWKRKTNREEVVHRPQESPAHPQYAAWAKMMTPPEKFENLLVTSAA